MDADANADAIEDSINLFQDDFGQFAADNDDSSKEILQDFPIHCF